MQANFYQIIGSRGAVSALLILASWQVYAQSSSSQPSMSTDPGLNLLFTDNPALADPEKFNLSYQQNQTQRVSTEKLLAIRSSYVKNSFAAR